MRQVNIYPGEDGYWVVECLSFQQIHNIQADVPPENSVAMFDAVA